MYLFEFIIVGGKIITKKFYYTIEERKKAEKEEKRKNKRDGALCCLPVSIILAIVSLFSLPKYGGFWGIIFIMVSIMLAIKLYRNR